MDARNTGALIAQRRKALGLTQKQLAERLLVSDKAVSKWENGASYPEVTLLPPLAQILGITVDELLAGAVREEEPANDAAEADDAPKEQGAAPSLDAHLASQEYLADRLGSVDDKMLLAVIALTLVAAYCGNPYGMLLALRNLVIILMVYIAFCVWHSKQRGRFAVLEMDTTVSRRRARVANRLFGSVILFAAALVLLGYIARFLIGLELTTIERYHIVLGWVVSDSYAGAWLCQAAIGLLFLALVGLFALAYRRMTKETCFRPLAVVLPAMPAFVGAALIGWQRVQTALANMPDYGEALATVHERNVLKRSLLNAGQCALNDAAIVIAVLVVVLLVLWRVTRSRVPLVSAVMLAVYAMIWLPSNALWLDIGYEQFIEPGGTENMTIQLFGLTLLLVLTALSAGIALLADSLQRKKA